MPNLLDKVERTAYIDRLYERRPEAALAGELRGENHRLLRFLIPEDVSILDIGCGDGSALAALNPSRGVGIDCSQVIIDRACELHPTLDFHCADAEEPLAVEGTFDYVLLNLSVGDFLDVWKVLRNLRAACTPRTRLVITYYNALWDPVISLATALGIRRRWLPQNWLSLYDIETLARLNGFEMITQGTRTLCPLPIPILAPLLNRVVAKFPLFQHLNLQTFCVARPIEGEFDRAPTPRTVSIIIPTRNELGNIRGAVERTAELGAGTELIFVDGDSRDGTVEEIEACIKEYQGRRDISLIHQVPPNTATEARKMLKLGKGDAVRKGFAAAKGDVLMILDSDLTVAPEDMDKFYLALAEERAEFINGNRLSYPMEHEAMRFLNLLANRAFGMIFTWLLGQRVKDTLCGTKVLTRAAYEKIAANRAYFGDFDPFGDFDLLFGAAKQNMKIMDLPVRYRARTYGEIKIERFKHGLLLVRMCWFAYKRFKLQ